MTTIEKISFQSKGVTVRGDLYLPDDFNTSTLHKAVVMTPPFPQVKDQALANYGPRLARAGFVALAFDYVSKGESDSYTEDFRNDDDFPLKWEALRNAISFLASRPGVDASNVFGLGMCGGGNILSSTIITDLRVKAFASVSGMMATDMFHFANMDFFKAMVTGANQARQQMFETGKPVSNDYFGYTDPDYLQKNPEQPQGQREGYDYYGTARGGTQTYPNFSNVLLSTINETAVLNLGEHYADKFVQPYCGIVGSAADTKIATQVFFDKVTSDKEFHEIEGATHVDLYDKDVYVDQVVGKLVAFFDKHSA
ncbi:MAG: dienelactone hydrolase family protein [Myxococcota bacterium]